MVDPQDNKSKHAIPARIKRNTLFLSITQALLATGSQLVVSIGSLIMLRFTDALALVGLTLSIGTITGAVASYPAGYMADARGRRLVLFLGLILSGSGFVLIYYAVIVNSVWVFILGLVINGLSIGALGQITVAALDMYPSSIKAEGIGYVITGKSLGSIGSPILVWATNNYATSHGMDNLAIPWLASSVLILLSGIFVYSIKPDPLEIARNLSIFYPKELLVQGKRAISQRSVKFAEFVRRRPIIIAIVNGVLASGVMLILTSLSSVILRLNSYSVTMISVAIALHVLGMFSLSSIFGRMADKWGRKTIIFIGSIILGISGLVTPLTTGYWPITFGLFFVGVGWSAVNVGLTTMIGDNTPPTLIGRMMGINQLVAGISGLFIMILGSSIAQIYGFPAVGFVNLVLSAPILLLVLKLKEPTPGTYDHP